MTTIYIAYKYNKNRETENLFITNEKDKAITLAIGGDYDEVVNDETGEVVWTKEKGVVSMNNFTAFKYGIDIEDVVDLFSTPDIDEAIAMAEADGYDEVVNDNTGEIVWKKEENIMTNITIYDRIQLGDTFHNSNGTDYIILAFDKEADVAILLNPKNGFTPYVGADGLRSNHWCSGHYFKTIQEACDWFNHKNGSETETKEDRTRVDICITAKYRNGMTATGGYYSYKQSAMNKVEDVIDEILNENPTAEINIDIDVE